MRRSIEQLLTELKVSTANAIRVAPVFSRAADLDLALELAASNADKWAAESSTGIAITIERDERTLLHEHGAEVVGLDPHPDPKGFDPAGGLATVRLPGRLRREDIAKSDFFSDAGTFLDALSPRREEWQTWGARWGFRGQADSWPLIPSLCRISREKLPNVEEADLLEYRDYPRELYAFVEQKTLATFLEIVDRAGLLVPHDAPYIHNNELSRNWFGSIADSMKRGSPDEGPWPPEQLLAALGLAQHFGVPTRLIDWSWKPYVAAYFAVLEAAASAVEEPRRKWTNDYVEVWAFNTTILRLLWNERLPDADDRDRRPTMDLIHAPQATNPNLAAQAGFFTYDSTAMLGRSMIDTIVRRIQTRVKVDTNVAGITRSGGSVEPALVKNGPLFRRLRLDRQCAGEALRLLDLEGVNAASIFPGYGGAAKALNERLQYHAKGSLTR